MPGTGSLNLTSAAALRDYVEDFYDELISAAFYEFKSSAYATAHEGIKGKLHLTELLVGELIRRWKKDFAPPSDVIEYRPRTLEVEPAKVELQICPQDYESTYLGQYRRKGQLTGDIPFEGYMLNKVLAKIRQEMEAGFWKAEAAAVPADTDVFSQLFNGFNKLIADLVTGGHTVITTPGGALTNSNMLDLVEDMWGQLSDAYKDMEIDIYCSYSAARKYWNNHITKYQGAKPERNSSGHIRLEYGEGWLIPLPGKSGSERLVMTPRGNFHYGMDDLEENQVFNFEDVKRNIDFWMDFKFGVQVALTDDRILVVNDLA